MLNSSSTSSFIQRPYKINKDLSLLFVFSLHLAEENGTEKWTVI